jgi:nucleotide-binding universal stress UspA family protein
VSTALVSGDAASEIARFANERRYALVVLATHGWTGVKRLLLGSVAERVVREARCSVLVSRPPPAG